MIKLTNYCTIKLLCSLQNATVHHTLKLVSFSQFTHFHTYSPYKSDNLTLINPPSSSRKGFLPKVLSKDPNLASTFLAVEEILTQNPINEDTQILIEKFLNEQFLNLFEEKDNKKNKSSYILDNISPEFRRELANKVDDINININNLRKEYTYKNMSNLINKDFSVMSNLDKYRFSLIEIFLVITNNQSIIGKLYHILFEVIQNQDSETLETYNPKTVFTPAVILIGKQIVSIYFYKLFKDYNTANNNNNNNNNNMKFNNLSVFKLHLADQHEKFTFLQQNDTWLWIGAKFVEILINMDMLQQVTSKEMVEDHFKTATYLVLSRRCSLMQPTNTILITPVKLPMIVKPKPHTYEQQGGYFLGDEMEDPMIIPKVAYKHATTVAPIYENPIVYQSVNGFSSVAYKINKEVLNYIIDASFKHNFFDDFNKVDVLSKSSKLSASDKKLFKSLISTKVLLTNILLIAKTFENVPQIYFPVNLDNRGRLYSRPLYLNYQGHDLAKCLLSFSNPGKIARTDYIAIEYYKVYGANSFGNGIDKKSFNKRLEWFKDNEYNIVNFENGLLLVKAEKKFLFLSFCMDYKRFKNFYDGSSGVYFLTHLPIQLDATCNGYQHLALLSQEQKIYKQLNLESWSKDEESGDFYVYVVSNLSIIINNKVIWMGRDSTLIDSKDFNAYYNLSIFIILRKNVKSAIMTRPYNASFITRLNYIKQSLSTREVDGVTYYYNPENPLLQLKDYDIQVLCIELHKFLTLRFTKIKELVAYLNSVAHICNKLGLPIIWNTPSGLYIKQSYLERKEKRIAPFTNRKTTISLTVTDRTKLDKRKQIRSLLPNFIHSLDGATMALLNVSFAKLVEVPNMYGVHDCFAVTADNIPCLIDSLRGVYIDLYTDKHYILEFDRWFISNLSYIYKDKFTYNEVDRIIKIDRKIFKLGKLPNISSQNSPRLEESEKSLSIK